MKMLVRLAVVGALLAALAPAAALAAPKPQVITLLSVQRSQRQTGAKLLIKDDDYQGKRKVGSDTLTCTIAGNKAHCVAKIVFRAGSITARFVITAAATAGRGTIIGGTGAYAGARGTLRYTNLNKNGTRTTVVLTLT